MDLFNKERNMAHPSGSDNITGMPRQNHHASLPVRKPSLFKSLSFDSPRVRALRTMSPAAFLSPSKEGEVPMDYSPCAKSPAGAAFVPHGTFHQHFAPQSFISPPAGGNLQLVSTPEPCTSHGQASSTEAQVEVTSKPLDPLPLLGDIDSDDTDTSKEMDPEYVFRLSPGSPPYHTEYETTAPPGFDDILIDLTLPKEETTAEKLDRLGVRRYRSHAMRKHLLDMSNTPPTAYSSRRSLFKRPMGEEEDATPVKRPKDQAGPSTKDTDSPPTRSNLPAPCPDLSDHHEERIKSAVDALQCSDLVADGSRSYCLPVVPGKHSDLKNIEPTVVANLLHGKFSDSYDKLTIIDCRYPYEYIGGHIKGALNIYTETDMSDFLGWEVKHSGTTAHKHILIFHCEFSSSRAPSLLRHLRKLDRELNLQHYPQLNFPEIYCLLGGYKDFFAAFPELCEPSAYVTMNDDKYAKELRHFRGKAKTWAASERFKRM